MTFLLGTDSPRELWKASNVLVIYILQENDTILYISSLFVASYSAVAAQRVFLCYKYWLLAENTLVLKFSHREAIDGIVWNTYNMLLRMIYHNIVILTYPDHHSDE